jgi:hypothetical protein
MDPNHSLESDMERTNTYLVAVATLLLAAVLGPRCQGSIAPVERKNGE